MSPEKKNGMKTFRPSEEIFQHVSSVVVPLCVFSLAPSVSFVPECVTILSGHLVAKCCFQPVASRLLRLEAVQRRVHRKKRDERWLIPERNIEATEITFSHPCFPSPTPFPFLSPGRIASLSAFERHHVGEISVCDWKEGEGGWKSSSPSTYNTFCASQPKYLGWAQTSFPEAAARSDSSRDDNSLNSFERDGCGS
jgi:hypothetical protein